MIRRLVLALTLAGATVAGGSLASPASAVTPVLSSCHQLTLAQAFNDTSDDSPAVPCSGPHTTQTIAVVTSPSSLAGLTPEQLQQQADKLCVPPLHKALGPTLLRVQTAYTAWYFAPTSAEIAAGENWVRCDVALVNGRAFQQLPHHVLRLPLAKRPISDTIRKCFAGKALTTCNHRHTQRSIGAFNLTAKAMASKAAFERLAHSACPGATGYVFPTADDIKAGYRVTICYRKTRR